MATKKDLQASQKRLDAIEKKIVENKEAREDLRLEARSLRDDYIAEEKVRESLLRQTLTEGDK